jgi:Zn-dependent protease with chaperone function
MTEALAVTSRLSLAILACAGLWWIIGVLLGALYPRLRKHILRATPPIQTHLLLTYSALPMLLSGLISLMLWHPSQSLHWVSAHCHAGVGCAPHSPSVELPLALASLTAFAVALIALLIMRVILQLYRHLRRYRQLQPYAEWQAEEGYWRLDYAPVLALTIGLFRPQIFLSDGLLRRLSPEQVAAVLAHERAHRRRRDGLRLAFATLWAPSRLGDPQGTLMHDLRLAMEHCCDLAAAREVGDPLRVAEAMIQAHRYLRQPEFEPHRSSIS